MATGTLTIGFVADVAGLADTLPVTLGTEVIDVDVQNTELTVTLDDEVISVAPSATSLPVYLTGAPV